MPPSWTWRDVASTSPMALTLRLDAWTHAGTERRCRDGWSAPTRTWAWRFSSRVARSATMRVVEGERRPTPRRRARAVGDPTEGALVVRRRAGRAPEGRPRTPVPAQRRSAVRVRAEADDDHSQSCLPTRCRWPMSFGWRGAATTTGARPSHVAFTKGGVDQLIGISRHVWVGQASEPLDEEWTSRIVRANDRLAQRRDAGARRGVPPARWATR